MSLALCACVCVRACVRVSSGLGLIIMHLTQDCLACMQVQNIAVSGGSSIGKTTSGGRYEEGPGQCGGVKYIDQSEGSISDGSGEANYENGVMCTFLLKAKSALLSHVVYSLAFNELDIENTPDCSYDSVSVSKARGEAGQKRLKDRLLQSQTDTDTGR